MLGLRRHTVRLDAYDPDWEGFGREECARIDRTCEGLRIRVEHAGSTSVPSLAAKPILDMVLGLPDPAPLAQVRSRLVDLGYIDRGKGEGGIGHLLVWEPEPDVRTVHVHAVLYGSTYWKQYVFFRDALRQDPELRRRYQELKRENERLFPRDRRGYMEAKDAFVRDALRTRFGLTWD